NSAGNWADETGLRVSPLFWSVAGLSFLPRRLRSWPSLSCVARRSRDREAPRVSSFQGCMGFLLQARAMDARGYRRSVEDETPWRERGFGCLFPEGDVSHRPGLPPRAANWVRRSSTSFAIPNGRINRESRTSPPRVAAEGGNPGL